MWPETEILLRNFYQPYNKLLANLLHDDGYLWNSNIRNDSITTNLDAKVVDSARHKEINKNDGLEFIGNTIHSDSHDREGKPDGALGVLSHQSFTPRAFNISGLPQPKSSDGSSYNEFVASVLGKVEDRRVPSNLHEAAEWLSCVRSEEPHFLL